MRKAMAKCCWLRLLIEAEVGKCPTQNDNSLGSYQGRAASLLPSSPLGQVTVSKSRTVSSLGEARAMVDRPVSSWLYFPRQKGMVARLS